MKLMTAWSPGAILFGLIVLVGGAQAWKHRALNHPQGVLIQETPRQTDVAPDAPKVFKVDDAVAEPMAAYSLSGRVLSTERYWLDSGSSIAPIDVAIGWGPMSDSALIDKLDISQGHRFYYYHWSNSDPVNPEEIKTNSANMHLIPATKDIKEILFSLRAGQLIRLQGYLVKVSRKDGGSWVSSLSRSDTGAGACELMWVQNIFILN